MLVLESDRAELRVDLGGVETVVAQQLLDGAKVGAALEEMGRAELL
ncbi:MAG: hypothetical protein AMXMBFR33_02710 [Candidatus Xenobia bacterium]